MRFRTLFSDTFINVEADSEQEAAEKAARILRDRIDSSDFIVWQDDAATPAQEKEGL